MTFNPSIAYQDGTLCVDGLPVTAIADDLGTPVYIYSLARALHNYRTIAAAFAHFDAHIHYSAKANANLALLRALIAAGAGVDTVSAGEIHRALTAGADPGAIVFAGVGKTPEEIRYALESGVGWFNVENLAELGTINDLAAGLGRDDVRVALRLNPEVTASTHPHIATGHGGAKFGLTADVVRSVLQHMADYPSLQFSGLHIHIGSQLGDVNGTVTAVRHALEIVRPFPELRTLNIGGGIPAHYQVDQALPTAAAFADALSGLVDAYTLLLEPGRSIIADAGILVTRLLYVKEQGGQTFYIVDASMSELMRPALYQARHDIVPLVSHPGEQRRVQVVGPVCETTDVLGRDVLLPAMQPGDRLAILTVGAYGMVMANNYNARPRPAEVVVMPDGAGWQIARRRDTWADLLQNELGV